jgi:hypothetical protein
VHRINATEQPTRRVPHRTHGRNPKLASPARKDETPMPLRIFAPFEAALIDDDKVARQMDVKAPQRAGR